MPDHLFLVVVSEHDPAQVHACGGLGVDVDRRLCANVSTGRRQDGPVERSFKNMIEMYVSADTL